ncbi:hypothetical protein BYT27DRAFT_6700883 [Phlegmacium glaucopus]|nr:hypothetical protein BYT27DRAFT_6700883 [Phlegmacium glaucopus]
MIKLSKSGIISTTVVCKPDLDTALQISHTMPENESEIKWKALGDRALTVWRCYSWWRWDRDELKVLAGKAEKAEKGQNNLAFVILLQHGDSAACVDPLKKT